MNFELHNDVNCLLEECGVMQFAVGKIIIKKRLNPLSTLKALSTQQINDGIKVNPNSTITFNSAHTPFDFLKFKKFIDDIENKLDSSFEFGECIKFSDKFIFNNNTFIIASNINGIKSSFQISINDVTQLTKILIKFYNWCKSLVERNI